METQVLFVGGKGPARLFAEPGRLQEQGGATSPLSKAACAPSAVGNKELAGALMDEAGEGAAWTPKLFSFHRGSQRSPGARTGIPGSGWLGGSS